MNPNQMQLHRNHHLKLFWSCNVLKNVFQLFCGQDGSFRIGMVIKINSDDDRALKSF